MTILEAFERDEIIHTLAIATSHRSYSGLVMMLLKCPSRAAASSLRALACLPAAHRSSRYSSVLLFRMASTSSWALKDSGLIKSQGYIDGKWVDAQNGETILVTNPATEEELGTVPEMGLEETKAAIAAADRAFKTWGKTTAKYRHDILKHLYVLMQEHHDDLGKIITLENGKTFAEGKGENAYSASFIEWYGTSIFSSSPCPSQALVAEEAVRTYGEHIPSPFPNIRNVVIKQPVGVVSILTPWNFPSAMITRKLGAALAAGCTAIIKPSPETPFSALAIAELARRAGVPDGVINVVTTQKNVDAVGRELCQNKIVKKFSFTGSTPVAKLLYGLASSTLKKVSIEAGGNSPFIVFDDADVEKAVEGAIACKFRGSGQTCISANRIYVQSSVYADFASKLSEKVVAFRVGNGMDEATTHGPLIHEKAIGKVKRHIDDAVSRGAQVLVGGQRVPCAGSFFSPTVLSDVPPDAAINTEETFGPVAALVKFETEEEVIALANDTDVGLAGYFFSRDVGRVWRVAEALEVGMVGTNTGLISDATIPFGGVKESGLGREGGHGIEEYLNQKLIAVRGYINMARTDHFFCTCFSALEWLSNGTKIIEDSMRQAFLVHAFSDVR
ncbi:Aldehyde/histidinol dehydrogenase [Pisolithus marmoratus]|nr:Aldehyde/histidinol dehydrogenase [Pisolithus marmoratus]